jgi:Sec-independent protein secretion pathway component TatC
MVAFTKWLVRIVLILGLLTIAFAAAVDIRFHQWALAVMMFILFFVTLNGVRVYFKRDRESQFSRSRVRLCAFWITLGVGMALGVGLLVAFK